VADLAVYPVLQWITMSIVDASILSPYPLLSAVMQRIRSHPKVAEYLVMDQEGKHGQ
jgi:glutathione S-transferase